MALALKRLRQFLMIHLLRSLRMNGILFRNKEKLSLDMTCDHRLLLVCFTERGRILHIISARLATKKERKDYEQDTSF
jgi:hypothetical protein